MKQTDQKPDSTKFTTVEKALKVFPVSREGFYRKLKSGELPCLKFGRRILVNLEEISEAMRQK